MQGSPQERKEVKQPALSAEAIETWRRNIKASTFSLYHLEMGRALRRQNALPEAAAALARAVDCYPEDHAARIELSDLLRGQGRPDDADALDKEGVRIDPAYREHQAIHWVSSLSDPTPEQEIARIEEAVLRFAGSVDLDLWKAAALLDIGRDEEARRLYAQADLQQVRQPETVGERQSRTGSLLFGNTDLERALAPLNAAVRLVPDLHASWYMLSSAELARGHWAAAEAAARETVRCAPKNAYFYQQLALVQLGQGAVDKATDSLNQALAVAPGHFDIVPRFALVEASRGQADAALAILNRALRERPNDFWLTVDEAIVYEAAGQHSTALNAIGRLVAPYAAILPKSLIWRPWAAPALARLLEAIGHPVPSHLLAFMKISP
ncbi:Tetratricopeptide repeat-containing protein [Azospirillum oryzae]|uniref:Tetratricopeptide repeat-containing protein n=1 Tax=Azospirillum oryzae TaxID=286727 RepID=A0A1X7EYL8_9PROT|nr:tetratricopeptide repeat protein [Azospirillum oryzae]SMF42369.1 Tetratricopeptide repeat-containing protein [Azospirillum oryzae]